MRETSQQRVLLGLFLSVSKRKQERIILPAKRIAYDLRRILDGLNIFSSSRKQYNVWMWDKNL